MRSRLVRFGRRLCAATPLRAPATDCLKRGCPTVASQFELRLIKLEMGQNFDRKFVFGIFTLFGGVLMLMPGAIHIGTLNSDKKITDMKAKLDDAVLRNKSLEERLTAIEGEKKSETAASNGSIGTAASNGSIGTAASNGSIGTAAA